MGEEEEEEEEEEVDDDDEENPSPPRIKAETPAASSKVFKVPSQGQGESAWRRTLVFKDQSTGKKGETTNLSGAISASCDDPLLQ